MQAGQCLCLLSSGGAGAPVPLQPAEGLFHPTPEMLLCPNLLLADPRMVPGTAGPASLTARSLQNPGAKAFSQASEPGFTPRVLKQPALQPAESLPWFKKKSKIQIKAAGQSLTLTHGSKAIALRCKLSSRQAFFFFFFSRRKGQ